MTYKDLVLMPSEKFIDWLDSNFFDVFSFDMDSLDEMLRAGNAMSELTNKYSYLASMVSYLKFVKRNTTNKEEKAELIDKESALTNALNTVHLQIKTISRMITIKQEINKELEMTDGRK